MVIVVDGVELDIECSWWEAGGVRSYHAEIETYLDQ